MDKKTMDDIMRVIENDRRVESVSVRDLLDFLQESLTSAVEEKERFGMDRHTERLFDTAIAQKEMVEALIGEPVNLQKDGVVRIGLDHPVDYRKLYPENGNNKSNTR